MKNMIPSTVRPDWYDHTLDASQYLKKFIRHNGPLLEKLDVSLILFS